MTQEALTSAPEAGVRPARWVTGRRARVLLCASGVSFMIMLDSNIVAVSLPSIARDLNATFADIEWVVSAYVLTFAALLMPSGALADRYGRRLMLTVGLAVFVLASLLCGLAPSALVLNAARAMQGVGAAIELSAALAVLGHEFQGAERAKAFGFWGTVVGIAVAVGPLVGGLITSTFGWRWAFFVNVPVGAALIWLAVDAVEESRDPNAQRLDVAGIVLFGGGLFCLVWALIGANAAGWSGRETLTKLLASAILLALFVAAELIQDRPMVDFALFRKRTFLGASFAMLGFASAAQVMMTYLPLYLQNVFNLSPAAAGLGMLPFALPLFLCPRIAVLLSNRVSGRDVLALGLAIVAVGNLATAAMVGAHLPYGFVAFGMLLTGCGAGLLNGETAKVSMSVIPPERGGMASGISGTLRFVGLVTGITGLGAVLASETQRHFVHATSGLPSGSPPSGAAHQIVSRIVAGDISGVAAQTPEPVREAIADLARLSFASGFGMVLLIAGVTAALAAALTFGFISPTETAPVRIRAIWSALTTGDRRFAEGGPLALRFPPDIAPFGATVDASPGAFEALGELLSPEGRVALVTLDKLKPYPGFEVVREAPIIQMVADAETPAPAEGPAPIVLGAGDVPDMLHLTQLTNPGPFGPRTHELGHYIGIRIDGALAAMAGERMRLDRCVEISAVCVRPDHRGKGYAALLVAWLVCKLQGEGAMPFLHAFPDNPAIALYERLGFTTRETLRLTVLARAP